MLTDVDLYKISAFFSSLRLLSTKKSKVSQIIIHIVKTKMNKNNTIWRNKDTKKEEGRQQFKQAQHQILKSKGIEFSVAHRPASCSINQNTFTYIMKYLENILAPKRSNMWKCLLLEFFDKTIKRKCWRFFVTAFPF